MERKQRKREVDRERLFENRRSIEETREGRVCEDGDCGADRGGFARGAAEERVHCGAGRGEGGREIAADAAQIFAGGGGRGSIVGDGQEDIVETGARPITESSDPGRGRAGASEPWAME